MTWRRVLQVALGVAVVVAIVLTVGAGPFLRGFGAVSPGAILAAFLLTAIGTLAAVARWRAVAAGLGLPLPWGTAIAAYYRSQFLNSVLPGGVLGDVHRAYRHGRRSGDLGLAARAVATERIAGQVVQFAIVAAALAALGLTESLRGLALIVAAILALGIGIFVATGRGRRRLLHELATLRTVFAEPRRLLVVVGCSTAFVASLVATFVVACVAVGVDAPLPDLVTLALVSLAAAAVPFNVGGWGPREAAAASVFALVGLGAAVGVAASTAFGVLTLLAVSPGALVLLADRIASPIPIPTHAARPKETIA